jgi:putative intracellular protease/amidase/YHS domain-containing protein
MDLCGPWEVFGSAAAADGRQLFDLYTVAATGEPVVASSGLKIVPDYTFETAPAPKVIVIPAQSGEGPDLIDWVRMSSKTTDVTMSVCTGAFVLAKTGLLSGKSATTHHGGFFRFAAEFPDVRLRRGARFVEAGNLATAGGITSGMDLALRVVERYIGKKRAESVVDVMEYQGKGWLDSNSNQSYAKMPSFRGDHPICPVCFMEPDDRSFKSAYKNTVYYFCSSSDQEVFDKNHAVFDRFMAEDLSMAGESSTPARNAVTKPRETAFQPAALPPVSLFARRNRLA